MAFVLVLVVDSTGLSGDSVGSWEGIIVLGGTVKGGLDSTSGSRRA